MLFLLDANVLITANSAYYPIEQIPEFWSWLKHQGQLGTVKVPLEIWEEMEAGHKDNDPLLDWIHLPDVRTALLLEESVDVALVQRVVYEGYAADLKDDEVEKLGRDPFLVAYGLASAERCVVTTEVSKPSKQRHNRKVPDVCVVFGLKWCGPFEMNRVLGFRTSWKP